MNLNQALTQVGSRKESFRSAWMVVRPVLVKMLEGRNFIVRLIGRGIIAAVDEGLRES